VNILRATATVGSLTLLSRVSGFARDALIAGMLGAGVVADAFFVAFKLANLLRRLFAEGAFNAGFVPLFARTLEGEGEGAARRLAEEAFSLMATILLFVVFAAELAMPWLVRALATGFDPAGPRYALAVELSRITFPYLLLISLAALVSGVLNGLGRFAAAAFAPVLLNLTLITALLLAAFLFGMPARLLAYGVLAAGVLQLALVLRAAARAGMVLRLRRPRITPRMRRLFQLVLPGALGAGVYQLNLVVDTWFASHLPEGAISYLFYADRLNQLPLGAVGVALGTALLPGLARALRAGHREAAHALQNRAIEIGMLLTLPAAAALIVVGEPIVRGLFERGAFDAATTRATAGALAAFATGLPAYVLIKILAPAFFAREDTATPAKIAALCLGLNVLLVLGLIGPLAHVGIALATGLSNWANAGLLAWVLWRRDALAPTPELRRRLLRMLLAAAVMAAVLLLVAELGAGLHPLLLLAVILPSGVLTFFGAAQLLGAVDLRSLGAALRQPQA